MALSRDSMPAEGTKEFRDNLNDSDPNKKLQKEWLQAKDKLISYIMTLRFKTAEMMSKIYLTTSTKFPYSYGRGLKVIEKLMQEYHPQDNLSNVEIKHKLASLRMKS